MSIVVLIEVRKKNVYDKDELTAVCDHDPFVPQKNDETGHLG